MTKSALTINQVTRLAVSGDVIHDFSIDTPQAQHSTDTLNIDMAGWIVGKKQPVLSIEVTYNNTVLARMPVMAERADVAKLHTNRRWSATCGYRGEINSLGLPTSFNLSMVAVLRGKEKSDRIRVPFAQIEGTHSRLTTEYTPRRQPLLITALGRSGTTWLMKLLSGAEEIMAAASYPYENRPGVYWMQMLQVLSSPGNHAQSTRPDGFESNIYSIGSNPYFHPAYLNRLAKGAALGSWFSREYVSSLTSFCQKSIEQYYDVLAEDGDADKSRYFMEKCLGGHIPWVYSNTYESPKEIVLIRDFRDMFCSSKAFNDKRGYAAFGQQIAADDEDWIRKRYRGVKWLVDNWKDRKEQAYLLRYEDLILRPEQSLTGVLDYLGIQSSPDRVKRLLKVASHDTPEMAAHRTTSSPENSIDRWKQDMDDSSKQLFDSMFGDILTEFGYSRSEP